MENTKKTEPSKTIHQWVALNSILKVAKIVGLAQGMAIILMAFVCIKMTYSDPVVVMMNGTDRIYTNGTKQELKIEKEDIKRFISEFIKNRYEWAEFSTSEVLTRVGSYVSDGFYQKLSVELKKESERAIKGKKVRQVTADAQVNVGDKDVTASFFKLVIVEGIALPITTEIAVDLIQGTVTRANPLGIYVNGIIERETGLK